MKLTTVKIGKKIAGALGIMAAATLLYSNNNTAQAQGFYVRAGGGYSIKASSSQYNDADPIGLTGIEASTKVSISNTGQTSVESLRGTLGEGFKVGAVAGYMFNQYIGAELGVYYFHGKEQTIGQLDAAPLGVYSTEKAHIRGVDLAPALVVTPGFEGINPYARVGFLIPVAGKLTINTDVIDENASNPYQANAISAETEVTPQFSLGYHAAIGVNIPLTETMQFFGEVEFKSLSLKSDEAEIKSFKTDGTEIISAVPTSTKKYKFEDDYTVGAEDDSQPTTIPTQYVNASGVGLNIGLKFTF